MNRQLISTHLSLRPIEGDDAADLHQLWIDEGVRRFLWDGKTVPYEQTEEIVAESHRLFEEHGFGIWGVRERNAERLIGFAGFWYFRNPPALELLFGVASDHWNRGVATESSRCIIRYGFEVLSFERIEASTDVANVSSAKVMEKLGMSFCKRAVVDGLDTVFYTLRVDSWPRRRQLHTDARRAKRYRPNR